MLDIRQSSVDPVMKTVNECLDHRSRFEGNGVGPVQSRFISDALIDHNVDYRRYSWRLRREE